MSIQRVSHKNGNESFHESGRFKPNYRIWERKDFPDELFSVLLHYGLKAVTSPPPPPVPSPIPTPYARLVRLQGGGKPARPKIDFMIPWLKMFGVAVFAFPQ